LNVKKVDFWYQILFQVCLNNMSLQHEVYPENYKESSRQIIVIKSFEVRDRLETSDINKMINLYTNKVLFVFEIP